MTENMLSAKDYKDAINVQDACNLSGVVIAFSNVILKIWFTARATGNESTDWVNSHPISVLYANKIAQLTGQSIDCIQPFHDAYEICRKECNEVFI